jgi:hypothetical protein
MCVHEGMALEIRVTTILENQSDLESIAKNNRRKSPILAYGHRMIKSYLPGLR